MSLEKIIKISIKETNFDGFVTVSNRGSRLVWWKKGKTQVNKLWTNFKVDKTIAFSCVNGRLSLF